jgi:hypothetical protein
VSEHPTPAPRPTAVELANKCRPLATRADRGDKEAARELRRLLDRPDVYRLFLDLAGQVRQTLVHKCAPNDRLWREVTEKELARVRAELVGPAPTAVERLLAERVAVGWLEVHAAEYRLALADWDARPHWQRQVDHAQRRFLAALRLLAAVRRLPRPAVQVNIGEQQVNVTG